MIETRIVPLVAHDPQETGILDQPSFFRYETYAPRGNALSFNIINALRVPI